MTANLDLTKSSHSEFVENMLEYISAFIITKSLEQVKCSSCINNLTATSSFKRSPKSDHDYAKPLNKAKPSFLHFRNSGNLKIPSGFVVNLVKYAEHIFKLYVATSLGPNLSQHKFEEEDGT